MKKRILALAGVLALVAVLIVPMAVLAGNEATQEASSSKATTIAIDAQDGVTGISAITFPPATPSTEVTGAYNDHDTSSSPQAFGATSLPVVTLVTSTAYKAHITITSGTGWTTIVTDENYYIDIAKARTITKATFDSNKSTYSSWGTDVNTNVALATANANDLYLTIDLTASAGKSGTSTLTILGES
ncbi:MAG: hypothetical protein OEW82_04890 [Dehalococcoidia bacterium]|nr:hypothetical protein [Dehalococcoidia bacterium]